MNRSRMKRESARQRSAARTRRSAASARWALLIIAVPFLLLFAARRGEAAHPEPREMDHAGHVVPHTQFAGYERVADVYAMAASVPNVLDGLHCYCECAEHSGHYSLLDCFASDHGARCDVCLSEAATAFRMTQQGATLEEIRSAIDRMFTT